MQKPLVVVPHETLRQISTPVVWDKKTKLFVTDLADTLRLQDKPKGVGLSAPQIGKNWRIFAILLAADPEHEASDKDLHLFLNPQLIAHNDKLTLGDDPEDPILEGCLSIPNTYGPVPRYTQIELEYQMPEGDALITKREKFRDFTARVIQHEYDHLEGILFTDYTLKYNLPLYEHRGKRMVEIDANIAKVF